MLTFFVGLILFIPLIAALITLIGLAIAFMSDDKKNEVPDKIEIIIEVERKDEKQ